MATEIELTENIRRAIANNELKHLTMEERDVLYQYRCAQAGVDPGLGLFEWIVLDEKLTLYARKGAADDLKKIHKLNSERVGTETIGTTFIVNRRITGPDGRVTDSMGAVALETHARNGRSWVKNEDHTWKMIPIVGDALANKYMVADTKADRRGVLAHLGLGMLDESEFESIPKEKLKPPSEKPSVDHGQRPAAPPEPVEVPPEPPKLQSWSDALELPEPALEAHRDGVIRVCNEHIQKVKAVLIQDMGEDWALAKLGELATEFELKFRDTDTGREYIGPAKRYIEFTNALGTRAHKEAS